MIKRIFGLLLAILGIGLAASGAYLVKYNLAESEIAGIEASDALLRLRKIQAPEIAADGSESEVFPDYVLNPDMDMPSTEIDNNRYIGTISIPVLGIELPVMEKWSYAGMKKAPGRYAGSVYNDDLIICGHNYSSHFGGLVNLQAGDLIAFTDIYGNSFNFNVAEIETLAGNAGDMIYEGEWDLTLFTCTVSGLQRVTVRAVRA